MAPVFVLMALAGASHGAARDVGRIDVACKLAPGERASKDRPRIFVETSGAVIPKPREGQWRELDSEVELHTLSESARPPNTEAIVRSTRGGTLVSMYFQDASASWAHVVDYCFRPEGRLARLTGTFNAYTPAGPGPGIRRRRTTYYDAEGAVLQTQSHVFDLATDRPLPSAQFLDEEDPMYPSLRALPFSSDLLPPAAPVDPDPDGLAAHVRERLPSVKACYDQALRRSPSLGGKAVARWTVDVAGKVTAFAWQSDEIESPRFATCAQKVIESVRFPARATPTVVSFPFVFGGPGSKVSVSPSTSRSDTRTTILPSAPVR
jgi:hypothetical protein